jgi:kynurenine formamidase
MCGIGIGAAFDQALKRRDILLGGAAAAAGLLTASARKVEAAPIKRSFERVVDLSHPLSAEFPTYFGKPGFKAESVFDFAKSGFNLKMLEISEHTGTHIDSPLHFSANGLSIDAVPVESLVAPLAVLDIKAKAAKDHDYLVTIDDITGFEKAHGKLPANVALMVDTGWSARLGSDRFRNADAGGTMHFPGFHIDAVEFLLRERQVNAIGIDTLSFDHGPSKDFKAHYKWLPAGKWAAENLANLDKVPPIGATIVAGAPRYAGCTGGPTRFLALV